MCRKLNETEVKTERDGVGRRPAVLFSPAVQLRDMWLPRQAVQSGRARWTHYRQGQDGIAPQNTIGSCEELERLKPNCSSRCVHVRVPVCLELCTRTTVHLVRPSVPPLAAPSPAPQRTHRSRPAYSTPEPGQTERLNVFTCPGQLRDEVANHRLPLVGHLL